MRKVVLIALIVFFGAVCVHANSWVDIVFPDTHYRVASPLAVHGNAFVTRIHPQYALIRLMAARDIYDIYSQVIYGYRLSHLIQNAQEIKIAGIRETYGAIVKAKGASPVDAWGKFPLAPEAEKGKTTYGGIATATNPTDAWGKNDLTPGVEKEKTTYGGIANTQDPHRTDAWGKSVDPALVTSWINYQRGKHNHFHH